MSKKRVFLIVLDSVGIGEMPDAPSYGDEGSNTIYEASTSDAFYMPNMKRLGFFDIDGVTVHSKQDWAAKKEPYEGTVARMAEASRGKDTTIGHWEIGGVISSEPLPVFPDGFPEELIREFEQRTGRKVICNKPYSGTEVIKDYGKEHEETGALIVYTSADSVLQIAAHESVVPVETLYEYCRIARELCQGKYGVGRIIARPFEGTWPDYKRTVRRHDFSIEPAKETMLDALMMDGKDVIAVGKIKDIFAGRGITEAVRTTGNQDGIDQTVAYTKKEFEGLCFVNLVDFDMLYGHRNDKEGYAKALSYFDSRLPEILDGLGEDDLLMITADHGCDPVTPSTDHSREYTPLVVYGKKVAKGVNLGTRSTFADIAATILDYFQVKGEVEGESLLHQMVPCGVPTPHNRALQGEIAETVLMPGDPLRAKYIAEHFLSDVTMFNDVRNMFGYTGTYKGKRVSVMGSGMGMPSIGIYSYELYHFYGVENIIRIGSAGGIGDQVHLRDVVIAMGASTNSNYAAQYRLPGTFAPIADYGLLRKAVESAEKNNIPVIVGNVLSSDTFYDDNPDANALWKKMNVLAVEMESAALYMNAARAGKKALGIFTVSDHVFTGESLSAEDRQNTFTDMMKIALETAL